MREDSVKSRLQNLNKNHSIQTGLFADHCFFGTKNTITKLIKRRYDIKDRNQINNFKKSFESQNEGEPVDIDNKIIVRTWAIRDRENDDRFDNLYMSCVDPKALYSSWEVQTDRHILENVEIGILSYKKQQAIVIHSSKSGMTAVESRNLSHNIGSHVLARWISELDRYLTGQSNWDIKKLITESKRLYEYIQTRMDFIAEISTSIPSWEMSIYFDEVLKDLTEQNILLGKIADSEGYNNVEIKAEINLGCERVSIPNGQVGKHAFFSIIENFVRNAAKHYKNQESSTQLNLEIQLKEPNNPKYKDKYIEMIIRDVRKDSCNKDIYHKLTSYMLHTKKESRFVDSNGIILPGGWGIKEMFLAANFLRKNSPEDLIRGFAQSEPPIIQISCNLTDDERCGGERNCPKESSGCLGMSFLLRKPKDLCVIGSVKPKIIANKFEINFITIEELRTNKIPIPHRLMLVPNAKTKGSLEQNPAVPIRVLSDARDEIDDEDYLDLYETFIRDDLNNGSALPLLDYPSPGFPDWYNNFSDLIGNGPLSNYLSGAVSTSDKSINFMYHPGEEQHIEMSSSLIKNKQYLQPLSGAFSTKSKIEELKEYKDVGYKRHFLLELIEAAITSVAIIDERISDFSKNIAFNNISKRTILENMGIFILDIDKKNISYTPLVKGWEDLEKKVKNHLYSKELHFVIVHQGILDKLEKQKKGNSKKFLDKLQCRWKIVDSGRGIPKEFKEKDYRHMRFIEISTISRLIEQYDKHALVQTLYSLRRPILNNEKEIEE